MLLLARALVVGLVTAHVAGVLLFTLVVAVEAAEEPLPVLAGTVVARVPELWARAAAVLGCMGVAVATARLRRRGVILGLGTLGVDPRVLLVVGALGAGAVGAVAGRVVATPVTAPGAWERGDGGWIRDGVAWPDRVGGEVRARPPATRGWGAGLVNAAVAGACGAALGLWAGAARALVLAALLLVVDVVARGLAERAAVPAWGAAAPAGLALLAVAWLVWRAPLFPRRWG
ncbi:MAG: hypothetical protein ACK4YP_17590 [Myxococcota bacterium]